MATGTGSPAVVSDEMTRCIVCKLQALALSGPWCRTWSGDLLKEHFGSIRGPHDAADWAADEE
jgi:hypothetical protein